MSDSLREKVFYILEDSDFNDLPYEERKRIGKYLAEQQILTLFQVINKDKANTTETWRKKTTAWLKNCVDSFYHEYRYPSDRKTEPSNSEKPNNCEHITEDGVTCAKYPACDDCLDNPLNKVKGSERLVKGSEQTEPTISKMEQVDKPQTCYTCEYEWRDGADEPCVYCYGGSKYKPKDEPQKHCHRPSDVACHPEQGDMWCRGCDYWYANEPQTERNMP